MKTTFHKKFIIPKYQAPFILIVDKKIQKKFHHFILTLEQNSFHKKTISVQAGESLKSIKKLINVFSELHIAHCQKDTILVAIGGGSILDFSGLLANLWMRGIVWHAYPTTLLAQVDSCLGGKTAINFKQRKNLLGTIYPPKEIHLFHPFLKSVPLQLQGEGSSEVFKHAILTNDTKLLKKLQKCIFQQKHISEDMIKKSLQIKKTFITNDLFEKNNLRICLNLGHTFGHALEQLFPKTFNHGAAIWWGLKIELHLSQLLGALQLSPWLETLDAILTHRKKIKLESELILKNLITIFDQVHLDKKNNNKKPLTYIALKKPGKPYLCHRLPPQSINKIANSIRNLHE